MQKQGSGIGLWIAVGAGVGSVFGVAMGNLAIGVAMGIGLGTAIGAAALAGRDKVTIVASPAIASFGAWVTVLQGTIFVIAVLMFREGIAGVIGKWLKKPM